MLRLGPRELPADALQRMHAGTLGGVVVEGLLKPELCAAVVHRLKRLDVPHHRLGVDFAGTTLGLGLDKSRPDWSDYFQDQRDSLAPIEGLFGRLPLSALFLGLLGRMSQVPVQRARHSQGRDYTPYTVRCLPETGGLPPHIGLEQHTRPPYADLTPQLDGVTQLSFFVMLQKPARGGLLRLYDLDWQRMGPEHWHRGRVRVDVTSLPSHDILLDTGDALVFDGGRWLHRVTAVKGVRWTAGGFLARAEHGSNFFVWS